MYNECKGEVKNLNTDKIYAEQIANEYAPKQASKVVRLRKLDAKAKRPARIFAYTFGIFSVLLFGVGMCLAMKKIGAGIPNVFILGIIIGIIGIACCGLNYLFYVKIFENGKQKYAYEIVQLAKEISEE